MLQKVLFFLNYVIRGHEILTEILTSNYHQFNYKFH